MKNLLIISVVVFACVSCATSQITTAEAPPYISVINVPSASQDVLYRRANSWFVDAFGSAESVIQYQDKEEGIIKGKYSFDIIKKGAWAKTPMLGTITIWTSVLHRLTCPLSAFRR
jgi:hypothetical protein